MTYLIDYTNLKITNAESNGAKPIEGIGFRPTDDPSVNYMHVVYINDDGRYWWQRVTDLEAARVDYLLHTPDATYTHEDYGLGTGLEL